MSESNNNDRQQELLLLGQIHGIVQSLQQGQNLQNQRMDRLEQRMEENFTGLDSRLREVEKKAAVAGALSGGAVAVGTALVVEGIKQFVMGKGIGN